MITDPHEGYDPSFEEEPVISEESLLINLAQLLDSKKAEGCGWSEWDQEQRDHITRRVLYIQAVDRLCRQHAAQLEALKTEPMINF